MRVLKENDYLLFEQLCMLTQKELKATLVKFLKTKYNTVVETKDYIYAIGDIPIALCAHMDTVFQKPPEKNEIYYDRRKGVMWSPVGLGADDRAGVFSIIQIIKHNFRPHIIFTTDEEKGCLGASALAEQECPFDDLRYVIQLDRRGSDDCVFYECENFEFVDYIEKFGFVENFGTFSDIYDLCPAWGIAGVNLSIGYYNEHSVIETLHVNSMLNTIEKVEKMLSVPQEKIPQFKFIYSKYFRKYMLGNSNMIYSSEEDYYNDEDYVLEPLSVSCYCCHKITDVEDTIPVTNSSGEKYFLCIDCLGKTEDNDIRFCDVCGEAFEPTNEKQTTCVNCDIKNGKETKNGAAF